MLFSASTKVQKDRKIMRQTDARMAKYSRASTFMHVAVYLLSLVNGEFYAEVGMLSIWLGLLLAFTSALRSFYLIRFEEIYSSGPNRWRNQYFIVSIINHSIWSLIVAAHIYYLGAQGITSLILIYTAGFCASIVSVCAPYITYLRVILFIGLVPPAAALALNDSGVVYCLMLMVFYLLLNHQGRSFGEHFWQGLESNVELRRRAEGLEMEKRGKDAKVEYKNELLAKISQEMRIPLNDVLGSMSLLRDTTLNTRQQELLMFAETSSTRLIELLNNVLDYSRIVSKELLIINQVFNLRSKLDFVFEELAQDANQHGVELYTVYEDNFFERVKGDAKRLGQVVSLICGHALQLIHSKELCAEISVGSLPNGSSYGLLIELKAKGSAISKIASEEDVQHFQERLGINIADGILKCMGGDLSYFDSAEAQTWTIQVPLDPIPLESNSFNVHPKIHNQIILLVSYPKFLSPCIVQQYESWRLQVKTCSSSSEIENAVKAIQAEDGDADVIVSIYLGLDDDLPVSSLSDVSRLLGDKGHVQVATSLLQRGRIDTFSWPEGLAPKDCLTKPLTRKKMHESLVRMLFQADLGHELSVAEEHQEGVGQRILLVEDHKVNQMVAKSMLNKIGYEVKVANNGAEALGILDDYSFDLILMDCQMPEMDGFETTKLIRVNEQDARHIPIIAMTANAAEGDEGRCLAVGMDDYLAKPVSMEDLEACLLHWIDRNEN